MTVSRSYANFDDWWCAAPEPTKGHASRTLYEAFEDCWNAAQINVQSPKQPTDMRGHREAAWARVLDITRLNWSALEQLDEGDKQLITGLAQECFGEGYEAGYERALTELKGK